MNSQSSSLFSVRNRLFTLALFLGLAIAATIACERPPARFAHDKHLGILCGEPGQHDCLTCASCHEGVMKEQGGGHPTEKDCSSCHPEGQHRVVANLRVSPSPEARLASMIEFSHDKHLALKEVGGQCIKCHAGVVSEAGGPSYPPMSTCFDCHNHKKQWDDGVCAPCHRKGELKKLFPQTYLKHGAAWAKDHGAAAAHTTAQCAQCHTSESCDDCHEVGPGLKVETRQAARINRDFTHPADFLTRHAMEAASSPGTCLSCHRTETCDSCHLERGVSAGRIGAANPHPAGWLGPDSSDSNHHGRAARRDILACASCHDQGPQTNCIGCHRVGGGGGNPHPSGWRSSRTPSDLMCAYCHEGGP